MSVGFLKNIGGTKRLRIVKPGNAAEDLSLDPNLVVFDSEGFDTLPVLTSGSFVVSANYSTSALTKIVTWPDPGYVPLMLWRAAYSGVSNSIYTIGYGYDGFYIFAADDGIYGYFHNVNYPFTVTYIAFQKVAG